MGRLTLDQLAVASYAQLALSLAGLAGGVVAAVLGVGLLLHGRGADLRAAGTEGLDRWRASTDVDGSAARRRAADAPAQESRRP